MISYHDGVLLWSRIHLKWISLCYCAKSWRQNYLSRSHFEDDSSQYISWSGSSLWISHTFVLFKNVTFTWINYLETWLHSDNTSCYYINYLFYFKVSKYSEKIFLTSCWMPSELWPYSRTLMTKKVLYHVAIELVNLWPLMQIFWWFLQL